MKTLLKENILGIDREDSLEAILNY